MFQTNKPACTHTHTHNYYRGHSHPSIAETTFTIGTICRDSGSPEAAMAHFQEALRIKVQAHGPDHASLGPIHDAIGDVHILLLTSGTSADPSGGHRDALSSYTESMRVFRQNGAFHADVADIHFKLGSLHTKMASHAEAVEAHTHCCNLRADLLDGGDARIATARMALARAQLENGDVGDALENFERCLHAQKDDLSSKRDIFTAANDGGALCTTMRAFDAALGDLTRALGDVADTHYQIGLVHMRMRRGDGIIGYEDALQCFTESHRIRVLQRGHYHVDVAIAMEAVGEILLRAGRYDGAMDSFLNALRVRRVARAAVRPPGPPAEAACWTFGRRRPVQDPGAAEDGSSSSDHADYARALSFIGKIFFLKGAHADAIRNYQEALQLRRTSEDANESDIATNLADLGDVCAATDEHDDALTYYRKSLQILRSFDGEGEGTGRACDALLKIGTIYHALGDDDRAKKTYEEALLTSKQGGTRRLSRSIENAAMLETLANFYLDTKSYDDARAHFEEALDIRSDKLGENDPTISSVVVLIGRCCYKKRDADGAMEMFAKALEMRKIKMREAHVAFQEYVQSERESMEEEGDLSIGYDKALKLLSERLHDAADSQHDIGVLHTDLREFESALLSYEGELGFKKLEVGEKHAEVANVLETIGTAHFKLGDFEKAMASFTEALEMKEYCCGENSVEYATSLNNIGNLYFALKRYVTAGGDCVLSMQLYDMLFSIV